MNQNLTVLFVCFMTLSVMIDAKRFVPSVQLSAAQYIPHTVDQMPQ